MTDKELSENLQAIDNHEIISLNAWEADFVDALQKVRKERGSSKDWWTPARRQKAAEIIEKYERLL